MLDNIGFDTRFHTLEIIQAHDLVTFVQQLLAQLKSWKSASTCNKSALFHKLHSPSILILRNDASDGYPEMLTTHWLADRYSMTLICQSHIYAKLVKRHLIRHGRRIRRLKCGNCQQSSQGYCINNNINSNNFTNVCNIYPDRSVCLTMPIKKPDPERSGFIFNLFFVKRDQR